MFHVELNSIPAFLGFPIVPRGTTFQIKENHFMPVGGPCNGRSIGPRRMFHVKQNVEVSNVGASMFRCSRLQIHIVINTECRITAN
jgi:hypothetical protein